MDWNVGCYITDHHSEKCEIHSNNSEILYSIANRLHIIMWN